MAILQFAAPPLAHYIVSGSRREPRGHKHSNRSSIGVFDLIIVRKGMLLIGEESETWQVGEGEALILCPDRTHHSVGGSPEDTEYYWIHFQTTGNWRLDSGDGVKERKVPYGGGATLVDPIPYVVPKSEFDMEAFSIQISQYCTLPHPAAVYEKAEKLVYMEQQQLYRNKWRHQLLFQEILQELASAHSANHDSASILVAEKAVAYIHQHYREELTAARLGAALNFHPVYIARCMNKIFGCTPLDYVLRCRLEHAKLLLLNTGLPVGRIAEEVGFHQAAYFSRCFAKYTGMTPRMYRDNYVRTEWSL